jgi:histidinol-phosphatase
VKRELAFAEELARAGGDLALARFGNAGEPRRKADGSWVTEVDEAVERELRTRIRETFPDHAILGEEEGLVGDEDAPQWVIDPIDGTDNFLARIPIWGTLVALRVGGESVAGAACAPALGELYSGARGEGAWLNGAAIVVEPVRLLKDATVIVGALRHFVELGLSDFVAELAARTRRDRGLGDFWGHMLVARGAAHAMVEAATLNLWDVAALEPIVAEAGGRLTGLDGEKWTAGPALCTCGPIHDEIVELVRLARARHE